MQRRRKYDDSSCIDRGRDEIGEIVQDVKRCEEDLVDRFLLVVLPGASGRRVVLQRLRDTLLSERVDLAVLTPAEDMARAAWSVDVVGSRNIIRYKGRVQDTDKAKRAVSDWLEGRDTSPPTRRLAGIMCYDEFGLELAANLCESFDLPGSSSRVVAILRDKHCFRKVCDNIPGTISVKSVFLTPKVFEDIKAGVVPWTFPSIVKPRSGAGSWFVRRINSLAQLRKFYPQMSRDLATSESVTLGIQKAGFVLEEIVVGKEVDIDGWCNGGKVVFGQVNDNRPAIVPFMCEVGGAYPSCQISSQNVRRLQQLVQDTVTAVEAAAGHGQRFHGVFHFEAILGTDGRCFPIELNGRFGGAECPACVESTTGHWLPMRAAELALGRERIAPPRKPRFPTVVSVNIHLEKEGTLTKFDVSRIRSEDFAPHLVQVVSWGASAIGTRYMPGLGSQSCIGWIAVGGRTTEEANARMREALNLLVIEMDGKRVPASGVLSFTGISPVDAAEHSDNVSRIGRGGGGGGGGGEIDGTSGSGGRSRQRAPLLLLTIVASLSVGTAAAGVEDNRKAVVYTPWWPPDNTSESVGILSRGVLFATGMMARNANLSSDVSEEIQDVEDIAEGANTTLGRLVSCWINSPVNRSDATLLELTRDLRAKVGENESLPALSVVEIVGEYGGYFREELTCTAVTGDLEPIRRLETRSDSSSATFIRYGGNATKGETRISARTSDTNPSDVLALLRDNLDNESSVDDCLVFVRKATQASVFREVLRRVLETSSPTLTIVTSDGLLRGVEYELACVASPSERPKRRVRISGEGCDHLAMDAVVTDRFVYTSGIYSNDTNGMSAFDCLGDLLAAAGTSLDMVLNCVAFIQDETNMQDYFAGFYRVFNQDNPPAPSRTEYVTSSLKGLGSKVLLKCVSAAP
eukprot:g1289.t1